MVVGLIAAELERAGIITISITLLREVAEVIQPPRALFVPFPLGFPLGEPNNSVLQHRIIAKALELLPFTDTPRLQNFVL